MQYIGTMFIFFYENVCGNKKKVVPLRRIVEYT